MINRIGFCCKYLTASGVTDPNYATRSTTVAWLNRQTSSVAQARLWDIIRDNLASTQRVVSQVGTLDLHLRMMRLGSELLPVYTHPVWKSFYTKNVLDYCEAEFTKVGAIARANNVRLSTHPGQFTVLGSNNCDIVDRSIEDIEYHADMARWMGYGQQFQDFKINVHMSGALKGAGMCASHAKLSVEARNMITVENDEFSSSLDDCLTVSKTFPIVLDLHHHWINSGEYIQANDTRIGQVLDSWRSVRPILHYSQTSERILNNVPINVQPDLPSLLLAGYKKGKLRAHSDFMWNTATNSWAKTFWKDFDFMVEAKMKNLASEKLFQEWSK